MRTFLIFTTMLITTWAYGQQPVIVKTDWLSDHINDDNLVILHVGSIENYQEGHIEGAQYVSPDSYVFDTEDHSRVYDLPELSVLEKLLESNGIEENSNIVLYAGGISTLAVTRLLFTLHYLGFEGQVSLLNGGKNAWEAKDLILTKEEPTITSSKLKVRPVMDLVVSKEQVASSTDSRTNIIDCRAAAYYNGIDVNEMHSGGRKGHIPGAKSIPYMSLFEKTEAGYYEIVSEDQLSSIFNDQGLDKDDEIILYCHIGLQLTAVYTTSKQLGYTNVKVFDGSFHEWGPDTSKPVESE